MQFSVSDQIYLAWQEKLKSNKFFRGFWLFWGIYCVAFFYAGVVFFFIPLFRTMAAAAFVAFLLARFLCSLVYYFYKKIRPYQRLDFSPNVSRIFLSTMHKRPNSLPSAHAACFLAISLVCFWFFPALGLLGFVATILNAAGRVILGYHHVTDILAGWFIGIISALAVIYWLWPLFTPH